MNVLQHIRIDRWADFVALSEQHEGWAFRGIADARWQLLSSLSRLLGRYCSGEPELWPMREERVLRVFRRKAHIYVQDASTLADTVRCLGLMQHHGAPTRLLDFTKSPFVAAFFALECSDADAAVYALNTPVLWKATPGFDPQLGRDQVDPRVPGRFERYFLHNTLPLIWFGEPAEMDRRLVAQSGLFVMPGLLDRPLESILGAYRSEHEQALLVKYTLNRSIRSQAMASLYRMNITHSTLFPDLEGLSRSMGYELEAIWTPLVEEFRALRRDSGTLP